MSRKVPSRKINSLALATLLSLGLSSFSNFSAEAAVTVNQIVTAVDQAKILANGTGVRAAINGSEVYISAYRNTRANDNDCKIEALLIAKTTIDLAPNDIGRVTVYFHNTLNIKKRKVVSVTAGDVKAFGSGQLGKEQLLASLTIKDDEVNDPATRLSAYLQQQESGRSRKRIDTNMVGETLEVIADADSDMSERDMRYEALRIAEKAVETVGPSAKKVKISFSDPAMKGSFKQIDFDASQLRNLNNSLQSVLTPVQIVTISTKVDVQSLATEDGADKDLRDKALGKLKNLDSKGVGVGPFLRAFFDVERLISAGEDEQAHTSVVKLISALDEQEERAKNAKEIKPTKPTPAVATAEVKKGASKGRHVGASTMPDSEILTDPDRALKRQEDELGDPLSSRITGVYERIILILNQNNRAADAQKFTQKLNSIRSQIH
ncbi:MAG: hypothetical protein Q8T09_07700 [Candidatus Melainabacteria bacterium]|nr:hypothetical protein [Candidatus Melainabacteria bacterium]